MSGDRFTFEPTAIAGVVVVDRAPRIDLRGAFERLYDDELSAVGVVGAIRQVNRSITLRAGSARGLHLQLPPHAEVKVVSCLRGAVLDVAVDLRAGSPTFGSWHAEELTADGHRSLVVPAGCAHGFQALTDHCELIYLHTGEYHPASESGVNLLDPSIGVPWPLPVTDLSDRDRELPSIRQFGGVDP